MAAGGVPLAVQAGGRQGEVSAGGSSAAQPEPLVAPEHGGAALEVGRALLLIERAGLSLPAGLSEGSPAWVQGIVDALCELSSRDALTGLCNRRQFELTVDRELDRVARAGEPALLLVADVDHFKRVNDQHGHPVGDEVLRTVAAVLGDGLRPMDTVARLGGEEFGLILPNCSPAFGLSVAERLRAAVERASISLPSGEVLRVTLSLGGAYAPPWVRSSSRLWMERADRQLYRAKHGGRNQVCMEQALALQVSAEEKGLLFGPTESREAS
jgi:diguanylate cyclase (GGDEF)-like protein